MYQSTIDIINNLNFSADGSTPQICSQDYLLSMAEGDIIGHTPWSDFGSNLALSSSEEDIWSTGASYVFPTVGTKMHITSSSAADDDGSTGINSITIGYLKSDFSEATETVIMNGTANVTTVGIDIFRINSIIANTVGTGSKAAGTITVKNLADNITYGSIPIGYTRDRDFIYTVPKGKTLYITDFDFAINATTVSKPASFTLKSNHDITTDILKTFFLPRYETSLVDMAFSINKKSPLKFISGSDIKVSSIGTAASAGYINAAGWIE